MKIVFFRQLLLDDATNELTASQQIVYSFLLSQSILKLDGIFHEGEASIDYVTVIEEFCDDSSNIELCDYNVTKMSLLLNLSKRSIYDSIEYLRLIGYITDCGIYCTKDIIYHGYFELKIDTGLTKQLLIFYSWLYEKAYSIIDNRCYYGVIDTFSYKIAEMYGTNEVNIRVMLSRLSDKGFVKRIMTDDRRYGKLIIKQ